MKRPVEFDVRSELRLAHKAVQAGDFEGAAKCADRVLSSAPEQSDALAIAAYAHLNLGRFQAAEATARTLVRLHSGDVRAHGLLASALGALNRVDEALLSADRAIDISPQDADGHVLRARLLKKSKRQDLAMDALRAALAIRPSAVAAAELAEILLRDNRASEAVEVLRSAASSLRQEEQPHILMAQAYTELHCFEEAEVHWRLAESYSRDRTSVIHARADSETAAGRFAEAEVILREALERNLDVPQTFFLLSKARRMTEADLPLINRCGGFLDRRDLRPTQAARLHYALGKTYDDLRDYERAIGHYDEANRIDYALYPRRRSFDIGESRSFTDQLIGYFTADRIRSLAAQGSGSTLPLFIVGMVRSGTTLTENIVGAHSRVIAGGEQAFWPQRAADFLRRPQGIMQLDLDLAKRLANEYLASQGPTSGTQYVTDKNPANIQLAALLHGLFPRTKIVHLQRHPVDNLLSMWMTPFNESVRCASNRENMVAFYRDYSRLVRRLGEILPPEQFVTVRYEDLTSDPQNTIESLLGFLGLEKEPACFSPETVKRAVLTPSVFQVRQPIHTGSQARWKNYEPWLGAFAELLAEHGDGRDLTA